MYLLQCWYLITLFITPFHNAMMAWIIIIAVLTLIVIFPQKHAYVSNGRGGDNKSLKLCMCCVVELFIYSCVELSEFQLGYVVCGHKVCPH